MPLDRNLGKGIIMTLEPATKEVEGLMSGSGAYVPAREDVSCHQDTFSGNGALARQRMELVLQHRAAAILAGQNVPLMSERYVRKFIQTSEH